MPSQRGISLVEFSVAAVPILLAGLGSIEAAQWFFTRQAASLALLQAGRAGITNHAHPDAMVEAFEAALLPLYVSASGHNAADRLAAALERRTQRTGRAPWQIEILSPTAAAFLDHGDTSVSIPSPGSLAAINNDYQLEQHRRRQAEGWLGGIGPVSGTTVFEANTLVLRLRYLHEPVMPALRGLMRALGTENGSYGQHAMARGYLPMIQEIALTMHSHPASWPLPAHGKIVGPQAQTRYGSSAVPADCTGLWCPSPTSTGSFSPIGPPTGTANPAHPPQDPDPPFAGPPQAAEQPPESMAPAPDDPSCGVTLCCIQ